MYKRQGYSYHKDIRVVTRQSAQLADDIHPNSREFFKKYMKHYPVRQMAKTKINQNLRAEFQGKWWDARVTRLDASLVHLYFIELKRTEVLYRGSTRLGPVYMARLSSQRENHNTEESPAVKTKKPVAKKSTSKQRAGTSASSTTGAAAAAAAPGKQMTPEHKGEVKNVDCLLYTSPSPRD